MRVAISGGSGLVGRALVAELEDGGHRCRILSRDPTAVRGLPPTVDVQAWDARSIDPLLELLSGIDAVVHLGGENIGAGRWTTARKRRILDSRVHSSRAVAAALSRAESPPTTLVQASAVGFYGPRGDEEISEQTSSGSDFLASVCRDWEAASEAVSEAGVRRVVIRTGIVLSPRGGVLPRMSLPFRLFLGGPAGNGRQWMPWIHVADEAAAIRFLLEHPEASGPFNLTAPTPVTNRDFGKTLGRILGRPSLLPAPAFMLRLLFGEMADLLLTGQRAVPTRLLELGYRFRFAEIEPALRDLLRKPGTHYLFLRK